MAKTIFGDDVADSAPVATKSATVFGDSIESAEPVAASKATVDAFRFAEPDEKPTLRSRAEDFFARDREMESILQDDADAEALGAGQPLGDYAEKTFNAAARGTSQAADTIDAATMAVSSRLAADALKEPERYAAERRADTKPDPAHFNLGTDAGQRGYAVSMQKWQTRQNEREERLTNNARYAQAIHDGTIPGLASNIARRAVEVQSMPQTEGKEQFDKARGLVEALTAIGDHPIDVIAGIALESLPASSPSLVLGALGSVAGPGGTALGAGIGSYATEVSSKILSEIQGELQKRSATFDNTDVVNDILSDRDIMSQIEDKALRRGVPVAVMDAFSAGVAGKLLGHEAETMLGKLGQGLAEIGIQGAAGGAGEALGSVAAGDPIDWKDVLAEAIGELGTGTQEIATGLYRDATAAGPVADLARGRQVMTPAPLPSVGVPEDASANNLGGVAPSPVASGPVAAAPAGPVAVPPAVTGTPVAPPVAGTEPVAPVTAPDPVESAPAINPNPATTSPTTPEQGSREEIGTRPGAFTIPKDLAGSAPRYAYGEKQFTLRFESQLDKALYILAQKNPSKADARFLDLVTKATGIDEEQARTAGRAVRDEIKMMAKEADAGELVIPEIHNVDSFRSDSAPAALPQVPATATIQGTPGQGQAAVPGHKAAPGKAGEADSGKDAHTVQTVYNFRGEPEERERPAANQVTAEQWKQVQAETDLAAKKKLFGAFIRGNVRAEKAERGPGRTPGFGPSPGLESDIIDAIRESGGVPRPGENRGGEFDRWEDAFSDGTGQMLVSKSKTGNWDRFIDAMAEANPHLKGLAGADPATLRMMIDEGIDARRRNRAVENVERQEARFAKDGINRAGGEPVSVDNMNQGASFTVKGVPVEVDGVGDDESVTLKDGPRYGTQIVAPGTVVKIDKDSFREGAKNTEFAPPVSPGPEATPAPVAPAAAAPEAAPAPVAVAPETASRMFEAAMTPEDIKALEEIEQALKKKGGQVLTGIDPEYFALGARMAGIYVKAGARTFRQYAQSMLSRLGEAARPYLLAWYENLRSSGFDKSMLEAEVSAQAVYDSEFSDSTTAGGRAVPVADRSTGGKRTPVARVVRKELIPKPRAFVGTDSYSANAGFTLDADQILGVNTALTHFENRAQDGGAFLLGDGTGFGKTAQILAIIDQYLKLHPAARILYATQNKQLLEDSSSWQRDAKAMGIDLKGVETLTYEGIKKLIAANTDRNFDLVVYDEAHNLKNSTSGKALAAQRIKSKHTLFATATPMDRPTGAAYFLAAITGESEDAVADKLGYEFTEREDKYTKEIVTYAVLKPGQTWAKVWNHIMQFRDAAITAGAMLRREYPFFGNVNEVEVGWDAQDKLVADDIEKHYQKLIDRAAAPSARRNYAGQKTLTGRRWVEQSKVKQAFERALKHYQAGGQVIIFAETDKEQSFPVKIPGATEGLNDAGKPVWRVEGALTRLTKMFEDAGIPVAHMHATRKYSVSLEAAKFQRGEARVGLATPTSGGTGINLDDVVGNRPRLLIALSPNLAGDVFDQVLGRVSRKTTQSEALVELYHNPNSVADMKSKEIRDRKIQTLRAIQGGEDADTAGFDPFRLGSGKSFDISGSERANPDEGEGEIGDVLGMPPIPTGVPFARLHNRRMLVSLDRILKGNTSVPAIMDALGDVMTVLGGNVPIRKGRFNMKTASGIFKPHANVIRLNSADNIPTATHEVAHAVSNLVFGSPMSNDLLRAMRASRSPTIKTAIAELRTLGRLLYGPRKPTAGYTAEGFAEMVRLWLTTEDAATKAPNAVAWFEAEVLGKNKALAETMKSARDKIDVWRGMGSESRAKAQQVNPPGFLKRIAIFFGERLKKSNLVDRFAPLEELSTGFHKMTGRRLSPGEDPYLIASAYRKTAGPILQRWVEDGMTDLYGNKVGPALKDGVALVKPNQGEQFWQYLWARYGIERWKEGKNPGLAAEDAVHLRQKFEREFPHFIPAAENYYDWQQGVRDYLRQAAPAQNGPLLDAIEAHPASRYYVPLSRELPAGQTKLSNAIQGDAGGGGGLYRMHGSGLPIKNIANQMMYNAEQMIARAHRDLILNAILDVSRTENMGWAVERIPRTKVLEMVNVEQLRSQLESYGVDTSKIPDDTLLQFVTHMEKPTGYSPIISRKTGSHIEWYQVKPEIYDLLKGIETPQRLGWAFELLLGSPARIAKLGYTGLRASFNLVTNPARDIQTFALQSIAGNPAEQAAGYFQSLANIVTNAVGMKESPMLSLYRQSGVSSATFVGGDIQESRRLARTLFYGKIISRITTPIESAREMMSFTESIPRMAEARNMAREMGWRPGLPLTLDMAVAIRLAAKRVTTDFTAGGAEGEHVNRIVPFFNPAIQGVRSMGRTFKEDQGTKQIKYAAARAVLKGVMLVTMPALFNWWRNKDDDWYKNLPWRERWLYLNIKAGQSQVLQIPMPQEWGASFMSLPVAAFESWGARDPRAMREAVKHLFSVTNPLDWPVLAKVGKEQWSNQVDFFNGPIVPRGELDLIPGMQRGEYTSWLGKTLGDAFPHDVSPRRVDAAAREIFGGVGRDLADTPNAFMRALGLKEKARESEPSDIWVVGRLFRRGGTDNAGSIPLTDFWDDHQRYTAWKDSNDRAAKNGLPPLQQMTDAEYGYAKTLEKYYPQIRIVLEVAKNTPGLEARQKLYRDATAFAKELIAMQPKKPAPLAPAR